MHQRFKVRRDGIVIGPTPLASYDPDKAGIKYSILENYYDEAEFLKEKEDYFNDQLNWLNEFDNFLFKKFLNVPITKEEYYNLNRLNPLEECGCPNIN